MRDIPLDLSDTKGLTIAELKAIEDMIDALVCAWVAVKFLDGATDCFGDDIAAIWVPRRMVDA
jgi:predicted RNase H-like nuclease